MSAEHSIEFYKLCFLYLSRVSGAATSVKGIVASLKEEKRFGSVRFREFQDMWGKGNICIQGRLVFELRELWGRGEVRRPREQLWQAVGLPVHLEALRSWSTA